MVWLIGEWNIDDTAQTISLTLVTVQATGHRDQKVELQEYTRSHEALQTQSVIGEWNNRWYNTDFVLYS